MPRKMDRVAYNAYMAEYMLRRYHSRMAQARTELGGCCACCGATENLEIDHIEWREKEIKLSNLWSIAKSRFDEEIKKCQLLCRTCHIEKSRTDISERKRERGGGNQWGPY